MTNAEKFKSPDERYVEFKKFCHKYTCGKCPVNEDGIMEAKCGFKWLDLEYKEELKPCPFCGEKARIVYANSSGIALYFVECKKCFAKTVSQYKQGDAIAAWNRRV